MSETTRHIAFVCGYVLSLTLLVPLIYGIVRYRSTDVPLRWFILFLVVSFASSIVMTVFAFKGIRNLWLANLTFPLYTSILLWMYSLWQPMPRTRSIVRAGILGFLIVWLVEIMLFHRFNEYTIVSRPLMGLIFVSVACLTIYNLNRSLERPLLDEPAFWISSGIMLYYGGTLVVNLISNILLRVSEQALFQALLLFPFLNFISYILFTLGLRCQYRLHRQKSSG